jgi:hypothetical protein
MQSVSPIKTSLPGPDVVAQGVPMALGSGPHIDAGPARELQVRPAGKVAATERPAIFLVQAGAGHVAPDAQQEPASPERQMLQSAAARVATPLRDGRTRTPVTPEQVMAFFQYQSSLIGSVLQSRIASHHSPMPLAKTLSQRDLAYVFRRLEEVQTEEDRRVRYTVPRSGDGPVHNLDEAYAEMNKLTQRYENKELDEIEYEGRANTLLAEVEALTTETRDFQP